MSTTVCVISGTRADFGLLRPLLREIQASPTLKLQLAVTGMHLSNEFGLTVGEIEGDGFAISARVESQLSSDTHAAMAKSTALGLLGFVDALERLRPDVVVVLGDRYETFAAAQAAYMLKIPIAHVHGGETTEGALDEAFRHCMTKLSQLHFASAAPYAERIARMGEAPERIHTVGALGVDCLRSLQLLDTPALERALGAKLVASTLLVTYHPATLATLSPSGAIETLLTALDRVMARAGREVGVFFTLANADAGGRAINAAIRAFVAARPERAHAFESLGQLRYLSLMRQSAAVIGNSSSGLFEAPYLGVPTVNIGDRQRGRLKPSSVIDCPDNDASAIASAIEQALTPEARAATQSAPRLFGDGGSARAITGTLEKTDFALLGSKRFYDGART